MAALDALTSFVARSTRITADWLNGVDKKLVGPVFANFVGDYGGKGDNSTNNDTAWTNAIADAANWTHLIVPAGTYRISQPVTLNSALIGKRIIGAGIQGTYLKQMTDSTPVFKLTKHNTHHITIADMTLMWANQQDGSDTDAYGIQFAHDSSSAAGIYFCYFKGLNISNGYIGIGTKQIGSQQMPVWGTTFEDIRFSAIHQRCIDLWSPTAVGQPNNLFRNLAVANTSYTSGGTQNEIAFRGNALEAKFDGIDLEGWDGGWFYFSGGNTQVIERLHVEGHKFTGSLPAGLFTDGVTTVRDYDITATSNPSASPTRLFLVANGGYLVLDGSQEINITITSGAVRLAQGQNGAASIHIKTPVVNLGSASVVLPVLDTDAPSVAALKSYDTYRRGPSIHTFTAGDTTPSVLAKRICKTANASSTSITAFDAGAAGQEIVVHLDANTTLVHSTALNLSGGDDITGTATTVVTLYYDGTNWYEIARRT